MLAFVRTHVVHVDALLFVDLAQRVEKQEEHKSKDPPDMQFRCSKHKACDSSAASPEHGHDQFKIGGQADSFHEALLDELRPWNAQDYNTYKLYTEHCENESPLKALGHKHILKTAPLYTRDSAVDTILILFLSLSLRVSLRVSLLSGEM